MQIRISPPTNNPMMSIVVAPPLTQDTFCDALSRLDDGIDQP